MNRPFDIAYIWKAVPEILSGLGVTLQFLIGTIVIGGLLGFLATWARLSGPKWLRAIVHGYIWIIRCTPSIVMMFLVFYGPAGGAVGCLRYRHQQLEPPQLCRHRPVAPVFPRHVRKSCVRLTWRSPKCNARLPSASASPKRKRSEGSFCPKPS